MDPCGTCLLRQAGDGLLDLLAYGHHQVGELVDDEHDVGEDLVSVDALEGTGADLLVVLTDVAHGAPCSLQEAVAVVHLDAEGVQRRHDLGHVGDDSTLGIGELGEEMTLDLLVDRELKHLGVDHDELQLLGALAVEERGDEGIQPDALPLTRSPCDEQVRHLRQVKDEGLVRDRLADTDGELHLLLLLTVLA